MSEKNYKHEMAYDDGWRNESGQLPVKLTSDYLFRILLQRDEKTLIALLAALLHMKSSDVTDIEVTNPIVVGDSVDDKEFHLDINVTLNRTRNVSVEMQVANEGDWTTRSLLYACRAFDQLSHGQDYVEAGQVIQISFTDFALFETEQQLCSTFGFVNLKNISQVYSDKMLIMNVNLRAIASATEEDERFGIDDWAKVFKAETWEDIRMLAEKNKEIEQAASSIWQLTEDEKIREQIRRREANIANYNRKEKMLKELQEKVDAQEQEIKETASLLDDTRLQLNEVQSQLNEKDKEIERLKKLIDNK